MDQRLLIVDVGHTRYKFASCLDAGGQSLPQVDKLLAFHSLETIDWPLLAALATAQNLTRAIISGTNRQKTEELLESWPNNLPEPYWFTDRTLLPIPVHVDFPEKVGIDRLLNASAANVIRAPGQPVITVSSGTAITVDVLNRHGAFDGGAILPGILLGAQSLHDYTTTLPVIDVWKLLEHAPPLLGKNTQAAISSGLYWGHLGAVREMVTRYTAALKQTEGEPLVLLTGGAAVILAPHLPGTRHEPALTLQGLAVAARSLPA
ncbi:type III pantothenate kinase [Planctomicrobium sp. SH664]|uniref:type III pantothenate kinase n=1 Tax=Planctomicrobium sp. SH664 TaxID=3448125 RepID=UPI003F5B37CD